MRLNLSESLLVVSALMLPGIAYAQSIPPIFAALALSPVVVLLLAVVLGVVSRSWRVGAVHAGLVVLWIVSFGVASYWVENDYVIWTPLALYGIHAVIMVVLLVRGILTNRLQDR